MNKLLLLLFLLGCGPLLRAQPAGRAPLYDPAADPVAGLATAMHEASVAGKHVLLKIGGNWCKWCYRFHDFIETDAELDSILQANYVVLNVNYSKENENLPFLASLEYPQRFGFPVLVVMSADGNRLHTQDTGYLESGTDAFYDAKKVKTFLLNWSPAALDGSRYVHGR
jgi:thioredoxin-related protein